MHIVVCDDDLQVCREIKATIQKKYSFCKPFLIVVVARNAIVDPDRKMNSVFCDMERAFKKLQLFSEEEAN